MNTTIRAETGSDRQGFWTDHAVVMRREAADGLFHGFAALHSGSFADMVGWFRACRPMNGRRW
jgi:hypothetical protein